MWIVRSIEDSEYDDDCRMPGEPIMRLITIESEFGQIMKFEVPENQLIMQEIQEGCEWPEDPDEEDEDALIAEAQAELMESYFDAMEELDELDDLPKAEGSNIHE